MLCLHEQTFTISPALRITFGFRYLTTQRFFGERKLPICIDFMAISCRFVSIFVEIKQLILRWAYILGKKESFCHQKKYFIKLNWKKRNSTGNLSRRFTRFDFHMTTRLRRTDYCNKIEVFMSIFATSFSYTCTKTRELIRYNDGILSTDSSEIRGIIYLDATILHTKYYLVLMTKSR